jgi:single-strand DNA-binding protein
MSGVNKVILIGNVGKDPEIRHMENGTSKATFPLATTETYRDREGQRMEQTEWHNIVLWRGLAELAEKYIRKGKQLYIEGKLRTRSWEDRDGNKRYTTEIIADNITLLGGLQRREDQQGGGTQSEPAFNTGTSTTETVPPIEGPSDDLPF